MVDIHESKIPGLKSNAAVSSHTKSGVKSDLVEVSYKKSFIIDTLRSLNSHFAFHVESKDSRISTIDQQLLGRTQGRVQCALALSQELSNDEAFLLEAGDNRHTFFLELTNLYRGMDSLNRTDPVSYSLLHTANQILDDYIKACFMPAPYCPTLFDRIMRKILSYMKK
jgi:hypothetical protein